MLRYLLFYCLAACLGIYGDPWGKDADLCQRKIGTFNKACPKAFSSSVLSALGEGLIQFHQEIISPADGPRSHFIPSSSQYTKEAMRKYGFFQGFTMGCDRLMRENNERWVYRTIKTANGKFMKYDPVP